MDAIVLEKILVLIKVFPVVLVLFVIPGYLLRTLFANKIAALSPGIDFTLGYSILLFSGLPAYFFQLTWCFFFLLWSISIVIIVLLLICFRPKIPRFELKRKFSFRDVGTSRGIALFASIYILLVTFIVLFLKGGHFIGDHQHHLAYINKLLYNNTITPFVPMYEGAKEIPYNYAYDLNYLFSAFVVKIAHVDLNVYWDNSPAIFLIFSFSAYLFAFKKMMGKYKLIPLLFSFIFVYYELHNWGTNLDAEFMPIPDQFARTIFLPVFFGLFIDAWKKYSKGTRIQYYIPLFIVLAAILFTHVYSYMVIIFVFMAFVVVDVVFNDDGEQKANSFILYSTLMLFSLSIFVLRIKDTTFIGDSKYLLSFIENYFVILISVPILLIIATLALRKPVTDLMCLTSTRRARIISAILLVIVILIALFLADRLNGRFIRSVPNVGKYAAFLRGFEFSNIEVASFYIAVGLFIAYYLPKISFVFSSVKTSLIINVNFSSRRIVRVIEKGPRFLFFAITLAMVFAKEPIYNVIVSKFVSQTYARRFVYFQETFYIFLFGLLTIAIYRILLKYINKYAFRFVRLVEYIAVLLLLPLAVSITTDLHARLEAETYNRDYVFLQKEDNVFEYIRKNVEPWSVIASYMYVAMDVVAQTPNYFVSSGTVHSPKVPSEGDRHNSTHLIFRWWKDVDHVLSQLTKYNVDYILTEPENHLYPPKFDVKLFNDKVKEYPFIFKKVYQDSSYILYKINYPEQ